MIDGLNIKNKGLLAAKIADAAYASLIEELDTTPKPGLVDKNNCGAHADMDYALFVLSAKTLRPYFKLMAQCVESLGQEASPLLQKLGIEGEREMLKATKGVNTHRGAIFSLGLFLSGACLAAKENTLPTLSQTLKKVVFYAKNLKRDDQTEGARLCRAHNIPTAFDYALAGYEEIFSALEIRGNFRPKEGENIANLRVLLYYMGAVKDANAYRRGGAEGARWLAKEAQKISQNFSVAHMERLDGECIKRNISAGGAADMLALCIFAQKLIDLEIIRKG